MKAECSIRLQKELLLNHKGGFILSYNDSPTIRRWYKDFEIIELPIQYTMGQGETRIGLNRKMKNSNHIKKTKELLIIKDPSDRDKPCPYNYWMLGFSRALDFSPSKFQTEIWHPVYRRDNPCLPVLCGRQVVARFLYNEFHYY